MPSDYEDLGIDPSNDEANKVLSEVLRAHGQRAVGDLERVGTDGVIKNVDYGSVEVSIMGKLLQKKVEEVTGKKIKLSLVEDMYYLALSQFPALKDPEEVQDNRVHYDIIGNFVDAPDIIEATRISRLSPVISNGVATEFAASLIQELQKLADDDSEDGRNAKMVLRLILQKGDAEKDGKGGAKLGDEKKEDDAGKEEKDANVPTLVFTKAGENARKKAEIIDTLLKLAGTGTENSKNANQQEVEDLAKNSDVKEILEMVKGMPRIDVQKSVKYKEGRPGEKIDVVFGDNITDARLSDFMLPDDQFYMNWLERQLRNNKRGNPDNSGPIYLLVDKSGSMDGERVVWAKTVALKLFQMARADGRDFFMRFFDDTPHDELIKVTSNDRSNKLGVVKEICTMESGGGTKIDGALQKGIEDIQDASRRQGRDAPLPTIILITDGKDSVDHVGMGRELERGKMYLISVMIQGSNASLEKISSKYMEAQKLDSNGALVVVDLGIAAQKQKKVKV